MGLDSHCGVVGDRGARRDLVSAMRTKRSRALRDKFGREYDRTVDKAGGRREAERELAERQKRHDELELKPLPPEARERYLQQWQRTQSRFVDDPTGAVSRRMTSSTG